MLERGKRSRLKELNHGIITKKEGVGGTLRGEFEKSSTQANKGGGARG